MSSTTQLADIRQNDVKIWTKKRQFGLKMTKMWQLWGSFLRWAIQWRVMYITCEWYTRFPLQISRRLECSACLKASLTRQLHTTRASYVDTWNVILKFLFNDSYPLFRVLVQTVLKRITTRAWKKHRRASQAHSWRATRWLFSSLPHEFLIRNFD